LSPDPTLNQQQAIDQALIDKILGTIEAKPASTSTSPAPAATASPTSTPTPINSPVAINTITIQFATPDATSVDAGVASVRGTPGVQGAGATSIAIGGTSVMRVTFIGDADALRAALQSRGWQVSQAGGGLSIRR
jgi:hypothetical protein